MPLSSKAQLRACFARKDPNWDCKKAYHDTKDFASLPDYVQRTGPRGGNYIVGWRILGAVMAGLPLICIFAAGAAWPAKNSGEEVVAVPDGWVFSMAWSIITLTWLVACLIATLNFTTASLISYLVFTALAVAICMLWLYLNSDHTAKRTAAQTLILLIIFAFCMLTCCVANGNDAGLASGLMTVPLCGWSVCAFVFSALDAQVSQVPLPPALGE